MRYCFCFAALQQLLTVHKQGAVNLFIWMQK